MSRQTRILQNRLLLGVHYPNDKYRNYEEKLINHHEIINHYDMR